MAMNWEQASNNLVEFISISIGGFSFTVLTTPYILAKRGKDTLFSFLREWLMLVCFSYFAVFEGFFNGEDLSSLVEESDVV